MSHQPPRRPWWLTAEEWRALWELHGGRPVCADCGTSEHLSVDHIQPRKFKGSHDLSNLTFRCLRHNSAKGTSEDAYWARHFYWDQVPEMPCLRTLQKRLWEVFTLDPEVSDWFAQPAGLVAGKLYLVAAIVGAGKTLAIPVVALAYNQLQRRHWTATRRADRILILTKEQAIRDQLASDLKADISGFGILPYAPRVAVLERYEQLRDDRWLAQNDALVACVHMFWNRKNGRGEDDLVSNLGKFPLIFIDEPHFGADQVRQLLDATPRSVVVGLTGSPIRRNMSLLRDYVLVADYTYQDAHGYDASMKYLSDDEAARDDFATRVRLDSANLLSSGQLRTIDDAADPEYDGRSLVTAGQVAMAVIRHLERCDAAMAGYPATHRDASAVTADLLYDAHAIIRCESRALANMLCKQVQAFLDGNRRRYPAERGWSARSIFVGDDELPGERLDPENHPWMRAFRKGIDPATVSYSCDRQSARILIVVGMAREGVNNPLCCVTAEVDGKGSALITVQGLIGRALRAVSYIDADGIRHVPPAILDTVQMFYHEKHDKTAMAIDDGMAFVLDMRSYFGDLTTIGKLISGEAVRVGPDDEPAEEPLTPAERIAIAVDAFQGEGPDWRTDNDAVERIIKKAAEDYAPDNAAKARRVGEWVSGTLRYDPDQTLRKTGHLVDISDVPQVAIVLDEREKSEPTPEQLKEFIRWNKPQFAAFADDPDEKTLFFFRGFYDDWIADRMLPQPEANDTLEGIRKHFTRDIKEFLKPWMEGDWQRFQSAAHKHIAIAVQRVVGAQPRETVGKDTKWDCPQVHVLLQRPDIRRAIQGYARSQLIIDGFCPAAASALGLSGRE